MHPIIQTGEITPTTSNAAFLQAIFNNSPCWINSKPNMGSWTGELISPEKCNISPSKNNYFSVATFKPGSKNRNTDNFKTMVCVVLDDVSEVAIKPSWKLETSETNFQLGFLLAQPISCLAEAQQLLTAISNKSLVNGNDKSGNNPVRYVRLPVGTNTKNGKYFKHILHEWHPELRYNIQDLIDGLGLEVVSQQPIKDKFEMLGTGVDLSSAFKQISTQESYYDPLLKITSHLISKGVPDSVAVSVAQAAMHTADDNSERWNERYKLIEGLVKSAVEKFGTKASVDIFEEFKEYQYSVKELTAPRYVIDGFITAEIFTIAGEAGVGKSSVLVTLCAIASHICKHDHALKPKLRRKIVYLTEDPEQVERILFALYKHWELSVSEDEIRDWITIIPVHRSDKEVLGNLIEAYSNSKAFTQVGLLGPVNVPPLFVFDTAAATFSLESENDNSEVSAAISICKKACLKTRTPLWIIHHIPKALSGSSSKGVSARGAGAWTGDVNGTMFIGKNDAEETTRYIWLGKHRFVPAFDAIAFEAKFDEALVVDELGEMVSIPYMYGDVSESSSLEKTDKANSSRESSLRKKIYYAVKAANDKSIFINRTALKKAVGGNAEFCKRMIAELINDGTLIEFEREERVNNNQKMALKVAKDWEGDYVLK